MPPITASRLADTLAATRRVARQLRDGPAAARVTGLVAQVAEAPASVLAGAVGVLSFRASTRGKYLTAANQYRRYCRDKSLRPWPVGLSPLRGWLLWRRATVSSRTGATYKATGQDDAISSLRRYAAYAPLTGWALSPSDERASLSRPSAAASLRASGGSPDLHPRHGRAASAGERARPLAALCHHPARPRPRRRLCLLPGALVGADPRPRRRPRSRTSGRRPPPGLFQDQQADDG